MRDNQNLKLTRLNFVVDAEQEMKQEMLKRRKKGLIRRLTVFGILSTICIGIMASTLISQSIAIHNQLEEKKELEKKLESLKEKEMDLKTEIIKLKDEDYISKLARKDYFLSDEGEIIFNLPDKE